MYRARVVEAAAARAQATAEWLLSHTFMPEEQLGKWTSVVRSHTIRMLWRAFICQVTVLQLQSSSTAYSFCKLPCSELSQVPNLSVSSKVSSHSSSCQVSAGDRGCDAVLLFLCLMHCGTVHSACCGKRCTLHYCWSCVSSRMGRLQVHWAEDDADGHPVLVVHLEAALQQDAAGAASAAEAILAHMETALQRRFDDSPGSPEQLVVVLDSRGASTLQVCDELLQKKPIAINKQINCSTHLVGL